MSVTAQSRTATRAETGRPCPYCRFPLTDGTDVVECGECESVHHTDCWGDNHGCAIVGCVAHYAGEPVTDTLPTPEPPPPGPPVLQRARPPRRDRPARRAPRRQPPYGGRLGIAGVAMLAFVVAAAAATVTVLLGAGGASPSGGTPRVKDLTPANWPGAKQATSSVQPDPRPELSPVRVQHVLALAQKRAERLGGTAQAAIWMAGWPKPVVTGSEAPMRMWSMSKVVVSLAMLQASGGRLSSESRDAMRAAITKSDNCAIRRVTLGLQDLTHGTEGARAGFDSVLAAAGIHTPRVTQQQTPEPVCQRYLQAHGHNLKDPMGVAVLFGTAEWTLTDAVQFARALADGKYGRDGEYVLRLMSEPKERDPHLKSFEFTADVDFGAGRALSRWSPAYKSGWGGSQNGSRDYLLGQIVVPTGLPRKVAMAVAFHPDVQPLHDDPGATDAPMALETMLSTLDRGVLSKLGAP